jgi:hypothetical protein
MTRPNLKVVPANEPKDITMLLRAEIAARDWAAVHVTGDKNPPLQLVPTIKRLWVFR